MPRLQDVSRVWRVAERLQYGMVGVNEVAITAEVRTLSLQVTTGGLQAGLGTRGWGGLREGRRCWGAFHGCPYSAAAAGTLHGQ